MAADWTEGGILRNIVLSSLPLVLAFGLQSAFNIVDAYFVGKISPEALAAVSISFPIVFLIISISTGLGVATTSLIARCFGGRQRHKATQIAEHSLFLALIFSFFFMFFGPLSSEFLFNFMGVDAEVRELAVSYMHIIFIGSAVPFIVVVGNSIIRGEGEMNVAMGVMAFSAVLNIMLDPIFIFTFNLGVEGAAYATVLARSVGLLIVAAYFGLGRSWVKIDPKAFRFNLDYVKQIFEVGFPSSLSNLSMSLSMFLLTAIVAGFGVDALAAFGVGFRLDSLAILPGLGISMAVVTLVGQNVGAKQYERVSEMTYKAGAMASFFMSLVGLVFFVFAEPIMLLFNSNPQVVEVGVSFLRIIPFSYLVVGFLMSVSGAFLGSGHALAAFGVRFLRTILLTVPAAYVLSQAYALDGVWWGMLFGSIVSSLLGVFWFNLGRWKNPA